MWCESLESPIKQVHGTLLEQDPAATVEAASFGGKREVLAEKGQGGATTP